jgi:membrane-associated protease RseP (regulator of RpoE activity)
LTDTLETNAAGAAPERAAPPVPTPEEQRRALVRLLLVSALILALSFASGALPTVLVVVALLVTVMLHELGHFAMAKWGGMKVSEFFVGFGPRLWSVRKGETEYGVKALPLGGYVRILGMHNLEPVEPEDEARTYRQAPFWRRMTVAVAGSTVHFLLALILLFVFLVGFGRPNLDKTVVQEITRLGSGEAPAVDAGFRPGDRIIGVDDARMTNVKDIIQYVHDHPGQEVRFRVERGGHPVDLKPTVLADHNPAGRQIGFLGVGFTSPLNRVSPITALADTPGEIWHQGVLSGKVLGSFFTPSSLRDYTHTLTGDHAAKEAGGSSAGTDDGGGGEVRFLSPVGFVRVASQASGSGIPAVLNLLIAINVFVGIFNLVPLLPLDGGHVAIAVYEKIRSMFARRPYHADVAKLLPLTYAVVMVIFALGATSLWLDIVDPQKNPFAR